MAYLEVNGVAVANIAQTAAYLRDVIGDAGFTIKPDGSDCFCAAIDGSPYSTPDADNAPWFFSSIPHSDEFMGMILDEIDLGSVLARAVTPRAVGGGSVGRLRPRPRVVAFAGKMYAQTAAGMHHGKRWITDVLSGSLTGCAPDTIRLLPFCPDGDATTHYRTLTRVGIADGPIFGEVGEVSSCTVQNVAFQIVAGNPYFRSAGVTCLDDVTLTAGS